MMPPNPKGKGLKPEHLWKKGQSGNPGGRPAEKPFIDAVRKVIREGNGIQLRKIAEKVVKLATLGRPWAVQLLVERLDGKTPVDIKITRDVCEMSLDEILGELAEVRAAVARAGGQDEGARESDSVH